MRHYRATNRATGEAAEYDADLPLPEHLGEDWRLEDVTVALPAPEDAPPPAPTTAKITKLAFRNRFTPTEKAGIELASLDNPSATLQARMAAASLRANNADIAAASYIDLMRLDTRAGVQALESFGLIAAGRAAAILDTPPAENEVWNAQ